MVTQMWDFKLPNGEKMYLNLQWKYAPFIEELREWVLANWNKQSELENLGKFVRLYMNYGTQ